MKRKVNGSLIGGLLLLGAGIVTLIGQLMPGVWGQSFSTFLLLGLGLVFMAAGIYSRQDGWFIPGGILTGLGAGVALLASSWSNRLPGEEGGWFLIIFALGWFLIPVMSSLFSDENHWWALIPGGIMLTIGLGLVAGAFEVIIPVALVVAGLFLLARQFVRGGSRPVEERIETPRYGPEADRAPDSFETLGTRQTGPEADHE